MNVLALTEYTASMMNVSMGKANRFKIQCQSYSSAT